MPYALRILDFCIICKYNFSVTDEYKKICFNNSETDTFSNELIDNYSQIIMYNLSNTIEEPKENEYENITEETHIENISAAEITYINYYSDKVLMIGDLEIINREIKEDKDKFIENITNYLDSIEVGKNYILFGDEYSITIKPTNISIPNSTNIDFLSCENILRKHYNISDSRYISFLQLEISNKNGNSLINNVGYQVFDDKKKLLDLSLCNDSNIQIFYIIKTNSSFNISFVSSFKDLNIDILNAKDSFFNDICVPYSDDENDVVLSDRIKYFF